MTLPEAANETHAAPVVAPEAPPAEPPAPTPVGEAAPLETSPPPSSTVEIPEFTLFNRPVDSASTLNENVRSLRLRDDEMSEAATDQWESADPQPKPAAYAP